MLNARTMETYNGGTFAQTIPHDHFGKNEAPTESTALSVHVVGGERRGSEKARILVCTDSCVSC